MMESIMDSSYYTYWAKTAHTVYHLLPYHLLDVAAVGHVLLSRDTRLRRRLADLCSMQEEMLHQWLVFMLALHDVGKFSQTFQQLELKVYNTLHGTTLQQAEHTYKYRHDWLGMFVWQGLLQNTLPITLSATASEQAVSWAQPIFGHHGKPLDNTGEMNVIWNSVSRNTYFDESACQAAQEFMNSAWQLVSSTFSHAQALNIPEKISPVASWLVAGFAVLADWIGSNSHDFPFCQEHQNLEEYWSYALQKAQAAITGKMLQTKNIAALQDFTTLFPFIHTPTPLQNWVSHEAPIKDMPQLFIIEDMTGAGKTEAALMLAHRIMAQNDGSRADGIFIALPTMATSNAMYRRLAARQESNAPALYQRLFAQDQQPMLVLAHGAASIDETFQKSIEAFLRAEASNDQAYSDDDETISALCSPWIADMNRKAFLADVGVGTIDQALLAVLYSKFQSLRLLGLHRKVLIVDEVHANDAYVHQILQRVLEFHAALGGSAILLSATLPQKMKQELVNAFNTGLQANTEAKEQLQQASFTEQQIQARRSQRGVLRQITQSQHITDFCVECDKYPLATVFDGSNIYKQPLEMRAELVRDLKIRLIFVTNDTVHGTAFDIIREAVKNERCVCWIRNTVKDAIEAYEALAKTKEFPADKLMLFHARFAMCDRQRIENEVLDHFGKQSNAQKRAGRILIATQVVEQSLDLDFDVLITDLAPMDCIIQRAGRLHRHTRDKQGNPSTHDEREEYSTLYVLAPSIARIQQQNAKKDQQDNVKATWYSEVFKGGAAVYPNHAELWRTAKVLHQEQSIKVPIDIRTFIEQVFGTRADEIETPKALLASEDNASSSNSAKRSMAMTNSIRLLEGYRHSYNSWFDDKKIPTRLGDESVTLRLAVVVGEEIRPFAAQSDEQVKKLCKPHDWRVAWAKSEVTVRASQTGELSEPEKATQNKIQELLANKEKMPDKCRYAELVLLEECPAQDENGENAEVKDKAWKLFGTEHKVYYSRTGFRLVKEEKKKSTGNTNTENTKEGGKNGKEE
ncbi:MAG: CRISPR-associated helicase Cas3' [Bacteroidota bacterium]|nr:CRISPR-associated helicase Cas3' [Candidatus Kapabacteria bacterium]MDW8220797.1 CRISPR-associated helicase Cas3' [Bacteroidota bacterium]